jgi:hypothetical protein
VTGLVPLRQPRPKNLTSPQAAICLKANANRAILARSRITCFWNEEGAEPIHADNERNRDLQQSPYGQAQSGCIKLFDSEVQPMRSLLIAATLFVGAALSTAASGPFLQVKQSLENGNVQFFGKNISRQPIVAYVVVAERPNHRSVWHGVYSGHDALPVGQTVKLGEIPAGSAADKFNASVDYVRLADGTTAGEITTDEAKEIANRFEQH